MHKLIILIKTPDDQQAFDGSWPLFLREAEKMPGLVREATIRVVHSLYGNSDLSMIHELYFKSYDALERGNVIPAGADQRAGATKDHRWTYVVTVRRSS